MVGVSTAIAVGTLAGWKFSIAAGWIATAAVYLGWVWAKITRMSAAEIEHLVQQRHLRRRLADSIVLVASIASLTGVGFLLAASTAKGPDTTIAAAIGFLSVIASWSVVHTIYTLRYAVHYYTDPVGGIDFNPGLDADADQNERPTAGDFAYLAFTVAATYGVTDTALQTRRIRITALHQAIVSYLFGTVILALTVQVIGSLQN